MSLHFFKVFGKPSDLTWRENEKEMTLLSPKFKCKLSINVKNEFEKYIENKQWSNTRVFRVISDFFIPENEWMTYEEEKKTPFECLKTKYNDTFDAIIGI